ncbi:accessory gene regulator B family protein [bacterium AH-315-E09]|nr:accessory gene regulator B family protein [bacterium AH-315-E09]
MIKFIISFVIEKLKIETVCTDTQLKEINYVLVSLASDFTKLFFLVALFIFLGEFKYFLFAFIVTTSLRVTVGGFHFKGYLTCFAFSLVYYFTLMEIYNIDITKNVMLILVLSFSVVLIFLAPAPSKQRKKINARTKKIYKLVSLIFIAFYIAVYFLTSDNFFTIPLWTIIFQSVQLILMKGVNMYEEHIKKQTTS